MKLTKSGFLKKRKHNFQEICPVFMTECIAETTRKGEARINFTSLGGKGGHNVIFGFFFSTTEAENQNADRGDVASIMLAPISLIIRAANNILEMTFVFHLLFSCCFQHFTEIFVVFFFSKPSFIKWWSVKSGQAGWLLMEKFASNRKFVKNLDFFCRKYFWLPKYRHWI